MQAKKPQNKQAKPTAVILVWFLKKKKNILNQKLNSFITNAFRTIQFKVILK